MSVGSLQHRGMAAFAIQGTTPARVLEQPLLSTTSAVTSAGVALCSERVRPLGRCEFLDELAQRGKRRLSP